MESEAAKSTSQILAILSGQRQDPWARCLRGLAAVAARPYGWIVHRKNRGFDLHPERAARVGLPVISVGNLTTGGTGKTPVVAWLARWCQHQQRQPGLISRGYRSQGGKNDEARELELLLEQVPHQQNPDRVAAARQLIATTPVDMLILDDAFQHRRIHRDLDLVLIDALEPFGFERLLPRGLLREPLDSLARADFVILSRADAVPSARRGEIVQMIRRYAPQTPIAEVVHRPRRLTSPGQAARSIDLLRGRRVAAFCGIGNPTGFRHTLEQSGAELVDFRTFPDHHHYDQADKDQLRQWFQSLPETEELLCTLKDLVKLAPWDSSIPLAAVEIEIQFLSGQTELEARLSGLLKSATGSGPEIR